MYDTIYHRNQTATIWDCHAQSWVRTGAPGDNILASLSREERDRVRLHCAGIRVGRRWRQVGDDRCDSGGCPDQRCAGGVSWFEYRRRNGEFQRRTVWSNSGRWCASYPVDVDVDDILAAES